MELDIQKLHIVHARVVVAWCDGADRHAYTKVDNAVADNDVFGACSIAVIARARFNRHRIVEVGNVKSLNEDVLATNIEAISVEREHGQSHVVNATKHTRIVGTQKQLSKIELTHVVHVHREVMHMHRVNIFDVKMHPR